jgi:hypothetical protein
MNNALSERKTRAVTRGPRRREKQVVLENRMMKPFAERIAIVIGFLILSPDTLILTKASKKARNKAIRKLHKWQFSC